MTPIIKRKGLTGFKSTVGNVLANVIRDASRIGNNYIEAKGYTTFLYGERQMNKTCWYSTTSKQPQRLLASLCKQCPR